MIRFPLTPDESAAVSYVLGIVQALTDASGNVRASALALDMSEHTLRHRMKDLGLVNWNRKAHPLSERQPRKARA